MTANHPVGRGACAALALALVVAAIHAGAPTAAGAMTVTDTWRA